MSGPSQGSGSISLIPSLANSSAMAPKIECAFFSFSFRSMPRRAEVGPQIEQIPGRDLAEHHAPAHAPLREGGDHFGKLADPEPDDFVHQRSQLRVRLAVKGHGDQASDPLGPGLPGKEQRQRSAAGDDPDAVNVLRHAKNLAPSRQLNRRKWVADANGAALAVFQSRRDCIIQPKVGPNSERAYPGYRTITNDKS